MQKHLQSLAFNFRTLLSFEKCTYMCTLIGSWLIVNGFKSRYIYFLSSTAGVENVMMLPSYAPAGSCGIDGCLMFAVTSCPILFIAEESVYFFSGKQYTHPILLGNIFVVFIVLHMSIENSHEWCIYSYF